MFRIELGSSTKRFLKKCDKIFYDRLMKKIKELAVNPFPPDVKRVVGRKDKSFRVRVGDYRIIYLVYPDKNVILIADIDKRPRIY